MHICGINDGTNSPVSSVLCGDTFGPVLTRTVTGSENLNTFIFLSVEGS